MFIQSILLFIFGLFVGTVGTMLGIGGGWIHVPFFMILYKFSPQTAVATSIAIIFVNTMCGSIVYYFQKRMDFSLAMKLSPAVIPGAIIGPFIVQYFTRSIFFMLFGILLVAIAILMFFRDKYLNVLPNKMCKRSKTIKDVFGNKVTYSTNVEVGFVGTFVIGFLSNLFGIGGGIIHVPFFILLLRIPTHITLGTSHLILCVSSFFGTIVYIFLGQINIDFMMPIALGSIIGARVGAELARKTNSAHLRKFIAFLLLIVACRIFLMGM